MSTDTAQGSDADAKPGKPRRNPIDQAVLRKVARALWMTDLDERMPDATKEQRQASWAENRKAATAHARRLIRRLDDGKVDLSIRD